MNTLFRKFRFSLNLFSFKIVLFIGVFSIFSLSTWAQQPKKILEQLSQDELINLTYDEVIVMSYDDALYVAQKLGLTIEIMLRRKLLESNLIFFGNRALPYIIETIETDEIEKSGARDLLELLRLFPGIFVGYDKHGVISIGYRGIWGQDGKILILVDGFPINDQLYSSTQLFLHYSAANIKRIELSHQSNFVSDPFSDQIAVIKVYTKIDGEYNGLNTSLGFGQYTQAMARATANLMFGRKKDDFSYGISISKALGNFTDQEYTNYQKIKFQASNFKLLQTDANQINVRMRYKKLNFKLLADYYNTYSYDSLGTNKEIAAFSFITANSEFNYALVELNSLKLVPYAQIQGQIPWYRQYSGGVFKRFVFQNAYGFRFNWRVNHFFEVNTDMEYNLKSLRNIDSISTLQQFRAITKKNTNSSINLLVESVLRSKYITATIGSRIHNSAKLGTLILPNIGLAANFKKMSLKFCYLQSGRYPSFGNYLPADSGLLLNEIVKTMEIEAAFYFSKTIYVKTNVFNCTNENPIYQSQNFRSTIYTNHAPLHTRGGVISLFYSKKVIKLNMAWAYYLAVGSAAQINPLIVNEKTLAAPNYVFYLNTLFSLSKYYSISTNFSWENDKTGRNFNLIKNYKNQLNLDVYFQLKNMKSSRYNIGLGVKNILNQNSPLIQPLNLGIPDNLGASREVFIQFTYDLRLKPKLKPKLIQLDDY